MPVSLAAATHVRKDILKEKRACKDVAHFHFNVEASKILKDKRACKDIADFHLDVETSKVPKDERARKDMADPYLPLAALARSRVAAHPPRREVEKLN